MQIKIALTARDFLEGDRRSSEADTCILNRLVCERFFIGEPKQVGPYE